MKERLDIYLQLKMSVKSRTKAQALIKGGFVTVNGTPVTKPGFFVSDGDDVQIVQNDLLKYVSRGGLKLEKALKEFGIDLEGAVVLDIGSSTGGFTDCALQHGADKVIAVDVGTDIMDAALRKNPKVELHENTDIRDFDIEKYERLDYCVCDASFISLTVALKGLGKSSRAFKLITLIKPQFECGPITASRCKGVISDKSVHREVLQKVLGSLKQMGFIPEKLTFSPVKGGDGNIEYLALFDHNLENVDTGAVFNILNIVEEAFSLDLHN